MGNFLAICFIKHCFVKHVSDLGEQLVKSAECKMGAYQSQYDFTRVRDTGMGKYVGLKRSWV